MSKQTIKCSTFRCFRHGDRRCCQGYREPCEYQCSSAPERCGLMEGPAAPPPEPWNPSGHKYRSFDPRAAWWLYNKGRTDCEIGDRLGVAAATITKWRSNEGIGPKRSPRKGEKT